MNNDPVILLGILEAYVPPFVVIYGHYIMNALHSMGIV